MISRVMALSLLLLVAACDTRQVPTMSNPTGQATMSSSSECPAGSADCPEEMSFLARMMPWNWF